LFTLRKEDKDQYIYISMKIVITENQLKSLLHKRDKFLNEQEVITTTTVKPVDLPPIEIPYKFKAGYWKGTPELASLVAERMRPVIDFIKKYQNQKIEISIKAMESQVTNFDNEPSSPNKGKEVAPKYLAKGRSETIKTLLKNYFADLKNRGVISVEPVYGEDQIEIGPTVYKKGETDPSTNKPYNPNDPKYAKEQRIDVVVRATGEAVSVETTCLVGMKIVVKYDPQFCRPKGNEKEESRCHGCPFAKFSMYANGIPIYGKGYGGENNGQLTNIANLNTGGFGDKEATGWISEFTNETAQQVLKGKQEIVFTYQCESDPSCHSDALLVNILDKNNKMIWQGFVSGGARISKGDGQRFLIRTDKCGIFQEGAKMVSEEGLKNERDQKEKERKQKEKAEREAEGKREEEENKKKGMKPRTISSAYYFPDEDNPAEMIDALAFVYAAVDKATGRVNYNLLLDPVYDKEYLDVDSKELPTWKSWIDWTVKEGISVDIVNQAIKNSVKFSGKLPLKPTRKWYR
jgi:hypothetical protein